MTARERLAKLFDDNSFVELINLLNIVVLTSGQEKKELPAKRRTKNGLLLCLCEKSRYGAP